MNATGKSLDELLLDSGVDPKTLFEAKKEYFSDIPSRDFDENITEVISDEVLNYIPVDSVKRYKVVPLGLSEDGFLEVGMLNPEDLTAKTMLQFVSSKIGKPYKIFLISQAYYDFILKSYSGLKVEVSRALGEYSKEQADEIEKLRAEMGGDLSESDIIREDAPIAKIVSNIIKYASENNVSDVHIEVTAKEVVVRYRIDGVLYKNLTLPKKIHLAIVARVKILSKIKIDEKRKPQDGRFSGVFSGRKIDFRVSTFPTFYGEKVVMRLLEQERGALPITGLGLTESNISKIKELIKRPYGIILVCGPTGSGKTNTLYSLLNEIDKESKNVISLENPIELNIPGVSQSQVRPDIGYTFANGLRSVLRQDPDIIMVGEIRDEETAKLAIQAALTGHLVFSTIHTNTASDVPQRLVDMGVEPYLIGPTLVASIGQRLIRKIVPEQRQELPMDKAVKEMIERQTKDLPAEKRKLFVGDKMYKAVATEENPTGMKGRTAVFEILEMTPKLQRIIIEDPSSIKIYEEARRNGLVTYKEDAILKALKGITTFEEVARL